MIPHSGNHPVEYEYTGKATILLDKHHDDYEVDFATGDKFTVQLKGNEVLLVHEDAPKVTFTAAFTDKKYLRIMKAAKPTQFAFLPHPKHPCYPVLPAPSMDIVPQLYEHFNRTLFNGGCPRLVVFKSTTSNAKTAGLAELGNRAGGKQSYRLSLRMDRIKHDPFLFVDVLIHEMIHLYNFRKYVETKDRSLVADAHGAAFQAHVDRINRFGFHINTYLDWETRKTLDTAKDYYLLVTQTEDNHLRTIMWSLIKPTILEMDNLLDEIRAHEPRERLRMVCYSTHAPKYRTLGYELTKGFKLKKLIPTFLNVPVGDDAIELVHTQVKDAASSDKQAKIKLNRRDMPFLVRSFDDYSIACRTANAYDYGNPETAWNSVALKDIEAAARQQLKDIHRALKMGIKPKEVVERMRNIPAIYMPRVGHRVYRKSVLDIIKAEGLEGLENYPDLEL